MNGTAANSSIWTVLLPVIVGGLIGLVGGFVGPFLLQWRKDATEKKRKRAEKFEELVAVLFECEHWVDDLRQALVYKEERVITVSPFAKLQAISLVYFPQFAGRISEFEVRTAEYKSWMGEAAVRRASGDIANINVGFLEAYRPFNETIKQLLNEFKQFAREELADPGRLAE
jgi:uncharacterized DUF497 family protein